MKYKNDKDIVDTFVIETKDHLVEIEEGILLLERNEFKNTDEATIHQIFRAAHSIKAGANLLEFKNIESIAYALEEILQKIRQGQINFSGDDITYMLKGLDKLNELIDNIHYCDLVNVDPLVNKLNSMKG